MEFKTSSISLGKKNTKSIKTTIPQSVAEELGLSSKDILRWIIAIEKGEKIAKVSKLR
jgi:hypothetical protein